MYQFHLAVTKTDSELSLLKDNEVVDSRTWPEGRDMGRKLFESIKDLLQKNSLKAENVSDFLLESDMPEIYTSMRIAETVKKVYPFGVTAKTNKQR